MMISSFPLFKSRLHNESERESFQFAGFLQLY